MAEEVGEGLAVRAIAADSARSFGVADESFDRAAAALQGLGHGGSLYRWGGWGFGMSGRSDIDYMRRALELAVGAEGAGEVPVGAVLVRGDEIIAEGANRPIATHDPTAHAEIETLRAGGKALGSYRLADTTLYVTLEPCIMCASAIVHARVRRVVFGAWDPKAGAAGSIANVFTLPALNHRVDVFGGVLMEECGAILTRFFEKRRP